MKRDVSISENNEIQEENGRTITVGLQQGSCTLIIKVYSLYLKGNLWLLKTILRFLKVTQPSEILNHYSFGATVRFHSSCTGLIEMGMGEQNIKNQELREASLILSVVRFFMLVSSQVWQE